MSTFKLADVGSIYHPDLVAGATRRRKSPAKYLIALVVLFFVISVAAFVHSLPQKEASATTASPAPAVAAPIVEAASGGMPTQEVHIAANGLVLLRAAKVISINGTLLTLKTGWGASTFTWTVTANLSSSGSHNYGTEILNQNGTPAGLDNIQSGKLVTVTGMLDQSSQNPTVAADTIRILQ